MTGNLHLKFQLLHQSIPCIGISYLLHKRQEVCLCVNDLGRISIRLYLPYDHLGFVNPLLVVLIPT